MIVYGQIDYYVYFPFIVRRILGLFPAMLYSVN